MTARNISDSEDKSANIESWLKSLKKAELIQLIAERAHEDAPFHDLLELQASQAAEIDLETMQQLIRKAYYIKNYISWREASAYSSRVLAINTRLENMLKRGQANDIVPLSEYALDCWQGAVECVDDDSFGYIAEDLQTIHLAACKKAHNLDCKQLAATLLKRTIHDDWGIFHDIYPRYAPVLGDEGRTHIRYLIKSGQAAINKQAFSKLGPLIEHLAREDVTQQYEAFNKAWFVYEKIPCLYSYTKLAELEEQGPTPNGWRDKAIQLLHDRINGRSPLPQRRPEHEAPNSLVEILIFENEEKQAWQQAKQNGCNPETWQKLCNLREAEHPQEVVEKYFTLARKAVSKGNNKSYHAAVDLITKALNLAKKNNDLDQADQNITEIKATHAAKRNLMQYLNEAGL